MKKKPEYPALSPAKCPVVLPAELGEDDGERFRSYPFQATLARAIDMKAGVVFALLILYKAAINKTML